METVEKLVLDFNSKTDEMFRCFDDNDFVKLNELFAQRQNIIDTFEKNPEVYKKEILSKKFSDLDIMSKDEKLVNLIKSNMSEIKGKLQVLNKKDDVKSSYGRNISGLSFFISKKIY